jgi:hypothetical protein
MFSGLLGLSSKEAKTQNIVIEVLASTLLLVVGYKELRRSKPPRSEAIPYTPQGAIKIDEGNGSYGICRVIGAYHSPSPDPRR